MILTDAAITEAHRRATEATRPLVGTEVDWWPDYCAAFRESLLSESTRPCTCHPDDNPPVPCPRKFALDECRKAASLRSAETRMTDDGERCQACGRAYLDVYSVPDDVWAKISPRQVEGFKGGGLLCPKCALERVVALLSPQAGATRYNEEQQAMVENATLAKTVRSAASESARAWISVLERRPPEGVGVWAWITGGSLHHGEDYEDLAMYLNGIWRTCNGTDDEPVPVTHWMPKAGAPDGVGS